MNHIQFIYIINLQTKMSFFYFLQAPVTNFAPMQTIYYIPSQYQLAATNLLPNNSTQHSQVEEKQNYILQSGAVTRESLQPEMEQSHKNLKKKRLQKIQKDQTFGWRNQNKDRNILSNILKAFIVHLLQRQGMKNHLEYITQKLNLQIGVSDFYKLVESNFPLTKSYISPKQFKQLLKDPRQPKDFLIGLKHLLFRFLRMDYSLILLKSPKIKKRSKLEQMKRSRDLIEVLFKS